MGTLTITKSYASGSVLMESHIDAFRSGLLTLFNTDKLAAVNFSGSMALTSDKFTNNELTSSDNVGISFGSTSDAEFKLNSSKNFQFNTTASTTEVRFYAGTTYYMEITNDKLNLPGDIQIGAGGAGKTVFQALSSYKKPVLVWESSTSISVPQNTGTSHNTVIYFPTFVASVTEDITGGSPKYRKCTITASANGYGTGDAGAASGGKRSGLTISGNNWYYVYAAKVRSGSDYSASSAKFVLVVDDTSPEIANESTLNTRYGSGCWLYLGLIRYGFGATGTSTAIPKFKMSNKGWTYFYEKSTNGYGGLNLAYSTTDADDSASALYTIAAGTSGNVIPAVIGHVSLSLNRERVSDWRIRETSSSGSDTVWRGGWQTDDGTLPHGHVVEVPNEVGYSVWQTRISSNAGTARGVTLVGFSDRFLLNRRHGHGI